MSNTDLAGGPTESQPRGHNPAIQPEDQPSDQKPLSKNAKKKKKQKDKAKAKKAQEQASSKESTPFGQDDDLEETQNTAVEEAVTESEDLIDHQINNEHVIDTHDAIIDNSIGQSTWSVPPSNFDAIPDSFAIASDEISSAAADLPPQSVEAVQITPHEFAEDITPIHHVATDNVFSGDEDLKPHVQSLPDEIIQPISESTHFTSEPVTSTEVDSAIALDQNTPASNEPATQEAKGPVNDIIQASGNDLFANSGSSANLWDDIQQSQFTPSEEPVFGDIPSTSQEHQLSIEAHAEEPVVEDIAHDPFADDVRENGDNFWNELDIPQPAVVEHISVSSVEPHDDSEASAVHIAQDSPAATIVEPGASNFNVATAKDELTQKDIDESSETPVQEPVTDLQQPSLITQEKVNSTDEQLFGGGSNGTGDFWDEIGQTANATKEVDNSSQADITPPASQQLYSTQEPSVEEPGKKVDKFGFLDLELDDDFLEDDLLEDEVKPAQNAAAPVAAPVENRYQPQHVPQVQAQPQVQIPAQKPYGQQYGQYPPQQSQQPHHLDIGKLNANKKKSDAYDFPSNLISTKSVLHKPARSGASQPQTPAFAQPPQFGQHHTPVFPPTPSSVVTTPPVAPHVPPSNPANLLKQRTASTSSATLPPKNLKKKQSSFFEDLPILPPQPRAARTVSTTSSLRSPQINNSQFSSFGAPSIGNAIAPPNPYASSHQPAPPLAPPSRYSETSQPPSLTPKPPPANPYAPPLQPNAASTVAASVAANAIPQSFGATQPNAGNFAPVATVQPTFGTLPAAPPPKGRYAPPAQPAAPPQINQFSQAGSSVNQSFVAPNAPVLNNGPTPALSPLIQKSTPFVPQAQVFAQPSTQGLNLSVPATNYDSATSPANPSPSISRYAPINHKRQASATANQYDPYSIANAQNAQNQAPLPPIPQYTAPNFPQPGQPVQQTAPAEQYSQQVAPPVQQFVQPPQNSVEYALPVPQSSAPALPVSSVQPTFVQSQPVQPVQRHQSIQPGYGSSTAPPIVAQRRQTVQPLQQVRSPPVQNSSLQHPYAQTSPQQFQSFQQTPASSVAFERRQFPLFSMAQGKIVYLLPGEGYQPDRSLHVVDSHKVLNEPILKDFQIPSKKNIALVEKFLSQRIDTISSSISSEADADELLLLELLQHKLKKTEGLFALNGSIGYDEPQPAFSDRPKQPLNKRNLVYHVVNGQKDEALRLARSSGDYSLALLIAQSISQSVYNEVIKEYLDQEFGSNTSSLLKSIYAIDADFNSNKEWSLLNWKGLATAAVSNHQNPSFFINSFGNFLKSNGKVLPAYILYVFGDIPVSAIGWPKSLKFSLYHQIYSFIVGSNAGTDDSYLTQLITAGFLLDYGSAAEAQKYIDLASAGLKTSKADAKDTAAIKQYLTQLKQLSEGKDSWFTRPSLDKVWGQLDKKLSKFISGDDEVTSEKTEGVFSKFSPGVSRNTSHVSLAGIIPSQTSAFGLDQNSTSRIPPGPRHSSPYAPASLSYDQLNHQSINFKAPHHATSRPDLNRTYTPNQSSTGLIPPRKIVDSQSFGSPVVSQSPKGKASRYAPDSASSRRSSSHSVIYSHVDEVAHPAISSAVASKYTSSKAASAPSVPFVPPQSDTPVVPPAQQNLGPPPKFDNSAIIAPQAPPVTHQHSVNHYHAVSSPPVYVPDNLAHPPAPAIEEQNSYGYFDKQVLPVLNERPSENTLAPKPSADFETETEDDSFLSDNRAHEDVVQPPVADHSPLQGRPDSVNEPVEERVSSDFQTPATVNRTFSDFGDSSASPYEIPEELQEQVYESHPSYTPSQSTSPYGSGPSLNNVSNVPGTAAKRFTHAPVEDKTEESDRVEDPGSPPTETKSVSPTISPVIEKRIPVTSPFNPYAPQNSSPVHDKNPSVPSPYAPQGLSPEHERKSPAANPYAPQTSSPIAERRSSVSNPYNPYAPQKNSPVESKFNPYQPNDTESNTLNSFSEVSNVTQPSKFEPYRPPSISAPSSSDGNLPSTRFTKFEPPTAHTNHHISNIPEEEEYYDDVVEDSDDDEDERVKPAPKKVEKPKPEKKAEKKDEPKKESGGWFNWMGKGNDKKNDKKIYKAKLGETSQFEYNEELKRWVNKNDNIEDLKAEAAPPPPPTIRKKPSTLTRPRSDSVTDSGSVSISVNGSTPAASGPPSGLPSGPSSGPSRPPSGLAGPRKPPSATSDLDSLMNLAGPSAGASTRRKKRTGYVNVMKEMGNAS